MNEFYNLELHNEWVLQCRDCIMNEFYNLEMHNEWVLQCRDCIMNRLHISSLYFSAA